MTTRLQEAINCNDGDQAARIIQDALGIESDHLANSFPKIWPAEPRASANGYRPRRAVWPDAGGGPVVLTLSL